MRKGGLQRVNVYCNMSILSTFLHLHLYLHLNEFSAMAQEGASAFLLNSTQKSPQVADVSGAVVRLFDTAQHYVMRRRLFCTDNDNWLLTKLWSHGLHPMLPICVPQPCAVGRLFDTARLGNYQGFFRPIFSKNALNRALNNALNCALKNALNCALKNALNCALKLLSTRESLLVAYVSGAVARLFDTAQHYVIRRGLSSTDKDNQFKILSLKNALVSALKNALNCALKNALYCALKKALNCALMNALASMHSPIAQRYTLHSVCRWGCAKDLVQGHKVHMGPLGTHPILHISLRKVQCREFL